MDLTKVFVRKVDLAHADKLDYDAIVILLNAYANDPLGGASPLPEYTQKHLAAELIKRAATAHVFLACLGSPANTIAICICFEGFSTFQAKSILNIHDLYVSSAYRRHGISRMLLQAAQDTATTIGCCKLTLEVLSKNEPAKSSYSKFGFSNYKLSVDTGVAEFWEKKL